ncbi:MAG: tetratricopeptide repeat protein [Roseococcus sp.]
MALRGRIDGVFEGMLRGWLWDPDQPAEQFFAELALDGRPLARLRANRPRADLERIGFGEGAGGFEYPLPIEAQDGGLHELSLVAEQQWLTIPIDRLSVVIPPRLHLLRGRVDRVQAGQCQGWVWDGARPDKPVLVHVVHEGLLLAQQLADRRRPDLVRAGIGGGAHGFALDLALLSPAPAPGAMLELRCVGAHGDWLLGEVPMPDQPRLERIAAPRRPAQGLSRRDILAAARKAEGERDYAAAARQLDAGLLAFPDDFDLLSIRARVHLSQQELEPAERLARAALKRSPGHPRAMLLLARIVTALGRHEEAVVFWAGIGPQDGAFRERLNKRSRSLLALGRPAEALAELAMALNSRPDDAETIRHMAEAAEGAGAPRSALSHWRRLLALAPEDRAAQERVAALQLQLAPPPPEALPSPLANPDLRDWRGPLEGRSEREAVWPSPGLALRSLGGRLSFTPVAPQQRRPGELPGYGLLLQADRGGAELSFALSAEAGAGGLRMGLEVTAAPESEGLGLLLLLRRVAADGSEAGQRVLRRLRLEARPRLHRFDMALNEEEIRALRASGVELVLRLLGPGSLQLHPPRPLSRLRTSPPPAQGFESLELPFAVPPAARPADALTELACPFTSIAIAAPPEAVAMTIEGVLSRTAAPFECVLTAEPDWPPALIEALQALALRDPRFRLLPLGAPAATGWVALIEAPPPAEPDWLFTLHQKAVGRGRSEAQGVMLEWCG